MRDGLYPGVMDAGVIVFFVDCESGSGALCARGTSRLGSGLGCYA